MREVLYDVEWQVLRMSFLNNERDDGGWTTVEGTEANLDRLREYLASGDQDIRRFRVKNLLNAVRMGNSGQGQTGSAHDRMVAQFKENLTYNSARISAWAAAWDWNRVSSDLAILYLRQPHTFASLKRNLEVRSGHAKKNSQGKTTRPELQKFLSLMSQKEESV